MSELNIPKRPLGKILTERGLISQDQLHIALLEQQRQSRPLGKILVMLGFLTEAMLRGALSENLGQESIDLSRVVVDALTLKLVPAEFAKRHRIFPVSFDETSKILIVATANPNNVVVIDQLSALLSGGVLVEPILASEPDIIRAIDQYYGYELSIDGILNEIETGEIDTRSVNLTEAGEYSQPFIRLVDALLADAVQRQVSDIHFEPESGFLRIRYRIDGVMRQIRALHGKYWPTMLVRLKVMSGMNIAENRAPQDGRISMYLHGRVVDFRVSVQPTTHGENMVLRVLDRLRALIPLEKIGFSDAQLATLYTMIARPEGMILVTGPTGSGKTSLLYSILSSLNDEHVNIMTLEDPVEYPLPFVRQTNVSDNIKIDFASGIRSIMRQDPDIILVGEIRDAETAEMSLRAAMTGHQVYSTLHSNSALGAIPRLFDLGLKPDIMAGNVIGSLAQRLLRKLCPHCKEPYIASEEEQKLLCGNLNEQVTLYRAVGCEKCDFQGFKGRFPVLEIVPFDDEFDVLISHRATLEELRRMMIQKGIKSLANSAIEKILDGSTTLSEAARVVDLTRVTQG